MLYQRQQRRPRRLKQCFGRGEFISAYLKKTDNVKLSPPDVNRWMSEIDGNPVLSSELARRSGCIDKKLHLTLIQNSVHKPRPASIVVTLRMDDLGILHLLEMKCPLHTPILSNVSLHVYRDTITFRCPWTLKTTSSRSIINFNGAAQSSPIRTSLQPVSFDAAEGEGGMKQYQFQVPARVLSACTGRKARGMPLLNPLWIPC